jgi:hypothetical protein
MKLWSPKEQHLRKHVRTPEITRSGNEPRFICRFEAKKSKVDFSSKAKSTKIRNVREGG